ncbi:MAG: amidase [Chloroflexi bacterium]|nr:amidase [Chloroflexota bacterium]
MASDDLLYLTIAEAARRIRRGELSPIELLQAHLTRISETNEGLNGFITVMEREAMADAEAIEKALRAGQRPSALSGIPIGVKDTYDVKGVPTTLGSKLFSNRMANEDSVVVARLRNAGAIFIGKNQLHELAFGATSENPHFGNSRNPWDTERATGGSSGGGAASVAAGLCMAAIGSDTGGSVRTPPALCGAVGFKPTFGRISRRGMAPAAFSLDTVGLITRSVEDAGLLLSETAGHDPDDPSSATWPNEDFNRLIGQGVEGKKVGFPKEFFYDAVHPDVEEAVRKTMDEFERLGAIVEEVSIPWLQRSLDVSTTIAIAEFAEVALPLLKKHADDIGGDVREVVEAGLAVPATDYIRCQQARTLFNRQLLDVMKGFDVLASPMVGIGAPRFDNMTAVETKAGLKDSRDILSHLSRPYNQSGAPAISVPCGFTGEGLPISLQLASLPFHDASLLQIAHAYEQATEWHRQHPPI